MHENDAMKKEGEEERELERKTDKNDEQAWRNKSMSFQEKCWMHRE